MTPTTPTSGAIPMEQPPKLKGRQRLLQTLQRISSSPSLDRMARSSSSGYPSGVKGSMSCVSLVSPVPTFGHSYSSSYSSQLSESSSAGFSTAPTSVPGTPGAEMGCFDMRPRIRVFDHNALKHSSIGPATVPLPADVQFPSMETALAFEKHHQYTAEAAEDYFPAQTHLPKVPPKRENFDFWGEMPDEIKVQIFQFLRPKEIIQCSAVSKRWRKMCFDGQLWIRLDASEFYRVIPAETLTKILTTAGPFVRDLNLRGCIQMKDRWNIDIQKISVACRNLEYFSLKDSRIDSSSINYFLLRNTRLVHINLSGLSTCGNAAMRIISQGCPNLQYLDVSWCQNIDTKGLQKVVQACHKLTDLRADEIKGFNDQDFLLDLYNRNTLERLLISHCNDFDDDSLLTLIQGKDPQIDILTDRPIVPPRKFRHLDFSRCRALTDKSVKLLAYNAPDLVGLRVSQCSSLTDAALSGILEGSPLLTHLDLEELDLTNESLTNLSKAPCARNLSHLNVSYCEALGDVGMIPILKACPALRSLEMDNTRVSDLTLTEAAAQVRQRNRATETGTASGRPELGLRIVVYDCQNVTWTGIREILSRNGEFYRRPHRSTAPSYPKEVISLKCFYGYQPTVSEHTKRVLRGELARATLLERKWAEYMIASEEAGAQGAGMRRRRRRAREAERQHANEQDEAGRGGRRRARSGGCVVM